MTAPISMQTRDYAEVMIEELRRTIRLLSDDAIEQLIEQIVQAQKVFVAGAGRSGLVMRAFAMRLMHMGLEAYVVGETVTPGLSSNDLLIIGSGSGETKSLAAMAAKAKSLNASIASTTINPNSTIGQLSDVVIQVTASAKDASNTGSTTIQPMGSLFEQSILLVFDAVILRLMDRQGIDGKAMFGRHANLE